MRNKKAEGSTMWLIIGAIMAILVLVIVMVIFQGRVDFLDGIITDQADCEEGRGGICVDSPGQCDSNSYVRGLGCGSDRFCCLPNEGEE
ncbi:hypothetical protein JXB11_01115 [Candidatus Woesearchaeota archaeon]|nr:hypothetical protein [Candidatus Woesearchaeota archaeon]